MIFARIRSGDHIPFPSARGIWCRCHAVVGAPPCATDTADTCAAKAESGTPGKRRASVNTHAPCLAVHMRSIDFGRPIAVSPLGKENRCSGEDSWIITQTGIRPRGRENTNRARHHYRHEPDSIHRLLSLVSQTSHRRYVAPGPGILVTREELGGLGPYCEARTTSQGFSTSAMGAGKTAYVDTPPAHTVPPICPVADKHRRTTAKCYACRAHRDALHRADYDRLPTGWPGLGAAQGGHRGC
jgi:hypothetical protein